MAADMESPAALAGAHGAGNFDQQKHGDHIPDHVTIQALRTVILQRRHRLAAHRARLVADLHFGGAQ